MTLGKGIGGGVPLSALLAKQACSCFVPGDQGGTYCGNPLMCAAGLAVMNTLISDDFLASSRRMRSTASASGALGDQVLREGVGQPPVRYGAARGCQEGHIAACPFLRSVMRCSFRSLKRIRYNCRTPSRFDP